LREQLKTSCERRKIARRRTEEERAEAFFPLRASTTPADTCAIARAAKNKTVGLRELFLPMLGNWTGVEQQAASPWAPATTARAMIVFKLDVVDQVVVQDYRQVRADRGEFSGHGVFMIDKTDETPPAQQMPILWWFFDSEGDPPRPARGGWHDDELILEKITPRGVAEHRFAVVDGQLSYRIRLRLGQATELEDFLSGTYRRISGH
jgi:hypothetical protein